LADVDAHEAITSKTRFEIAAVSKQFTAIGILLLEQAGRLSLSDRLSRHVSGCLIGRIV
jgi:CubicO group peptidase (beta-lactamase class C family)